MGKVIIAIGAVIMAVPLAVGAAYGVKGTYQFFVNEATTGDRLGIMALVGFVVVAIGFIMQGTDGAGGGGR